MALPQIKLSLARACLVAFLALELAVGSVVYLLHQKGMAQIPAEHSTEATDARRIATERILSLTDALRNAAAHIATHPQTIGSLSSGSEPQRLAQQANIRAFYPNAEVRLLPVNNTTVTTYFADPLYTVYSRQPYGTGATQPKKASASAPLEACTVHPVTDAQSNLRGFVVIDQQIPQLRAIFDAMPASIGYAELQQFNVSGAHSVLLRHGDESLKTATPNELVDLAGTTWRVAMWHQAAPPRIGAANDRVFFEAWLLATLLVAMVSGALYFVLGKTLQSDMRAILTMFGDIRHNRLRKSYPASLGDFAQTFDLLYQLGKMMVGKQRQVANEAALDHLSQVSNRRSFEEKQRELYKTLADGWTHSLLILDIDNFKQVNDTFGHDAGDALIVQFGKALKDHLRASDFVARLGGDEFCVLFPNTPLKRATELAERLRASMPKTLELTSGVVHKLEWSGGLSEYSRADSSENMALSRADAALLDAKRAGRNRTMLQAAA